MRISRRLWHSCEVCPRSSRRSRRSRHSRRSRDSRGSRLSTVLYKCTLLEGNAAAFSEASKQATIPSRPHRLLESGGCGDKLKV
jgi:hypothetical protein